VLLVGVVRGMRGVMVQQREVLLFLCGTGGHLRRISSC
jgi:hypothetical protein